jgi:hypothetical protein
MSVKKSLFVVLIVVLLNICFIQMVNADLRFGFKAADGTIIQPYIEQKGKIGRNITMVPVFIPQYYAFDEKNPLEYDEFILYIEFADQRNHTVAFTLHEQVLVRISETDNFTGRTRTYNKTIYQVVDSINKTLRNGINNEGSNDYCEVIISKHFFSAFDQSDNMEKFVINYLNIEIVFYHQTNPGLVDVTQQRGEWQSQLFLSIILQAVMIIVAIKLAKKLQVRTHGIWFQLSFWFVAFVISWGFAGVFGLLFLANASESEIYREIAVIPVPLIELIIAFVVGMWTPAEFQEKFNELYMFDWKSDKKYVEKLVGLLTNNPDQIEKKAAKVFMKKFYFHRKGDKVFYFEKKNSIKEVVQAIVLGPRYIHNISETFTIKSEDEKQYFKFVEKYKPLQGDVDKEYIKRLVAIEISLLLAFNFLVMIASASIDLIAVLVLGLLAGIIVFCMIYLAIRKPEMLVRSKNSFKQWIKKWKRQPNAYISLTHGIKTVKKTMDVINDRVLQIKLGVPVLAGFLFIVLAIMSYGDVSQVFAFLGLICLIVALLIFAIENVKNRDELVVKPLSRNVITAMTDATFVVELEEGLQKVVSSNDDLRRRFIVHQQLSEVRDILEAERRFYPRNFKERFGEEKVKKVNELIKKNKKGLDLLEDDKKGQDGSSAKKGGNVA